MITSKINKNEKLTTKKQEINKILFRWQVKNYGIHYRATHFTLKYKREQYVWIKSILSEKNLREVKRSNLIPLLILIQTR